MTSALEHRPDPTPLAVAVVEAIAGLAVERSPQAVMPAPGAVGDTILVPGDWADALRVAIGSRELGVTEDFYRDAVRWRGWPIECHYGDTPLAYVYRCEGPGAERWMPMTEAVVVPSVPDVERSWAALEVADYAEVLATFDALARTQIDLPGHFDPEAPPAITMPLWPAAGAALAVCG